MAKWDDGYVTDVVYTSNFYREITPAWLASTSLLLGYRPPDLRRKFSYADLGCGNGLTALIVAAACPHAEIWGFDFNPAHIEFATRLAAEAGLTNARFVESSFAALGHAPDGALPEFDFIVSHGVLSWISPENRRHLMAVVAQRLKPGGLVYLSYNVTTGWSAMVPVRRLMRMLSMASAERTDIAAPGVLDFVDRLKGAGALFFQANPGLESRLTDIRRQDARYIAHEYLNQDWHPLMFADIAAEMLEAKCRYIGSATLAENIEAVTVPTDVAPLLRDAHDPVLRETLRDLGCAQTFRRDIYRKGTAAVPGPEQQMLLEQLNLAGLGLAVPDDGPTFVTPIGNVTGKPEIYGPLLSMLETRPLNMGDARRAPPLAGLAPVELLQAFSLLIAGGYAHPTLPEGGTAAGRDACRRLNLAIAQAIAHAVDLTRLASPVIGSAVGGDMLESLAVGEMLAGRAENVPELTTRLLEILERSGRNVQRDGQVVTDRADATRIVADGVADVLERRLPVLRRLGVVSTAVNSGN